MQADLPLRRKVSTGEEETSLWILREHDSYLAAVVTTAWTSFRGGPWERGDLPEATRVEFRRFLARQTLTLYGLFEMFGDLYMAQARTRARSD